MREENLQCSPGLSRNKNPGSAAFPLLEIYKSERLLDHQRLLTYDALLKGKE
jgi:hypothetical protein